MATGTKWRQHARDTAICELLFLSQVRRSVIGGVERPKNSQPVSGLSLTKTLCTLLRMSFPKAPPRSSNRSNSLPTCSSVVKEIRRCTLVKGAYLGDRCQSRAKAVRSTVAWGLFRRPVVRSGGAVRRPGKPPRLVPLPAAESSDIASNTIT